MYLKVVLFLQATPVLPLSHLCAAPGATPVLPLGHPWATPVCPLCYPWATPVLPLGLPGAFIATPVLSLLSLDPLAGYNNTVTSVTLVMDLVTFFLCWTAPWWPA